MHHPSQMHENISDSKNMHVKAKYLILEKHLRYTLFLRIRWFLVKVFDSGMNFVSHQNFCFASLAAGNGIAL